MRDGGLLEFGYLSPFCGYMVPYPKTFPNENALNFSGRLQSFWRRKCPAGTWCNPGRSDRRKDNTAQDWASAFGPAGSVETPPVHRRLLQ
ncbi:hypothetical protein TNCV_4806251 [Trichonephila clavipes]|nr:hypothetical protein TNCV_4806251 [Trichonephila clavipes]